jgi:tRNA nucleotidyltransferase (CCA-adding enzyme)
MMTTMLKDAQRIGRVLLEEGFEAHLVGGCVRDTLLDIEPNDYDIATNARPDDLIRIAEKYKIPVREVGKSFGVVLFVLDGTAYEVATYREDGIYSDNRRPDTVEYSDSIVDDLARRDFTINAMAIDMSTDNLVDPFNGLLDLYAKKLKTVGVPALRFNEDYLRILRFFRFAARFDMEPELRAMVEIASDPHRVNGIANERVGMEIKKILMLDVPSKAFKLMLKAGVLDVLFPELDILKVIPQDHPHLDSVWDHTMKALDYAAALGADYQTRMAVLLHDCGKADAMTVEDRTRFKEHSKYGTRTVETVLEALRTSKRFSDDVRELVHYHMTLHHVSTKGLFKRYINKMGIDQTKRLLMLNLADTFDGRMTVDDLAKIARLDEAIEDLQSMNQDRIELRVSGKDIMHYIGIPSGPDVGKVKRLMEYLAAEEVIPDNRGEQIIFLEALKENWFK